jgi:hypothetical protein
MFNKYVILELESIPREKMLLNAMIIDARRTAWRSNITRFAAINLVVWSLIVMFVWSPMRSAPAQSAANTRDEIVVVYLPLVATAAQQPR